MGKKTMKHFKAASISADKHNKREKQLEHPRPELQPENTPDWIWEAEDKESVYMMRKRAEREYYAKERTIKGKNGSEYTTHRSLPKNAEPVKEAVVVIKEDTTINEVKKWALGCQEKYGVRPVGVYLHLDEGHWGELDEDAGQTEDMYRRTDGKEWKRLNEKGNWEYWKPNFHAHVVFDWFDHDKACCINLGRKIMSDMEDDLACQLGMERGTPSGKKGLDANTWKALKESERINRELTTSVKKYKSLQTMIDNLTREKDMLEKDLIDGYGEKNRKDRKLQELNEKIADKQVKLNEATIEIDAKMNELTEIQTNLQEVEGKWLGGYRKLAEMKERNKQLNDTIAKLQPIAEQVPALQKKIKDLQEEINKAETQLSAMPEKVANARKEGKQEGKEEAVDELYRAAHLTYKNKRPSPTTVGERYAKYRQLAQEDLPKAQKENDELRAELDEQKEKMDREETEHAAAKIEAHNRSSIMEYLWPGAWKAAQIMTIPGKWFLSPEDRKTIRNAVGSHPKWSIQQCHDLIGATSKIYPLSSSLIKEIYEFIAKPGTEEVGKNVEFSSAEANIETQTLAACLFYGLVDAATQYSESAGGGGGSSADSDWGRKKDEDKHAFASRCLLEAKNMLQPSEGETISEVKRRYQRR